MSHGEEEEGPSREELLEYTKQLEAAIDECNDTIAELTRGEIGKRRGGAADSGNATYYEQENRTLRERIEEDAAVIAKLREDLAAANVKVQGLVEEKVELDKRIRGHTKRIEELERDNNGLLLKSQSVEEKSKQITKQKSDNIRVAQQMAQENEQLRLLNEQLSTDLKASKDECVMLKDVLVKYSSEKDLIEAHRNNLDVEKEQLRERIIELESELLEMADKVEASVHSEIEWENKFKAAQEEIVKLQQRAVTDIAAAKADAAKLQQQIVALQDSTQTGKVQRQLQELTAEHEKNNKVIEELKHYLLETAAERDALQEQIDDYETQIGQRVADQVAAERNRIKTLEAALGRVQQDKGMDAEHYRHLEEEKAQLVRQVDDLMHWKAVYESGHGLQQLSSEKRRLTDDLKRRNRDFEEQSVALSKEQQTREVLALAFERLKKECGKPADFHYPDLELHREVESTVSVLNAQLRDLEKQIDMLEEENTRLRKALRNQAGVVEEGKFKYPGMDAEMLMKVNDFATALREGSVELPLNDRSRQLLEENRQLKADMKALNAQLLRFERGYPHEAVAGAHAASTGEAIISDAFGSDMKALVNDNAEVHRRLRDLQMQLDALLRNQSEAGAIKASDIAAILSQNNELVLRELEELRRSSNQSLSAPPEGAAPSGRLRHQSSYGSQGTPMPASPLPPSSRHQQSQPAPASTRSAGSKLALELTPMRPMEGASQDSGRQTVHQGSHLAHGATPYWTPRIGRGGMPFATPGPMTPHGKQLLNNTLYNMNLPPEDWAMDVRELNAQLIECLELLYEREQELSSQKDLIASYEQSTAEVKTQMIVLYHEFAENQKKWQSKETQLTTEHKQLSAERDDLRLKLRRMEEMAQLLQQQNKEAMEWKLVDLTRKVTIYEVNEAILSRKYISLSEQLETESKKRVQLEVDFTEMESSLKQRILFLEQYKLAAGSRLAIVQGKLDKSVPQEDYLSLQMEMEALREDHLITLRREVEARSAALKALDRARELRSVRLVLAHQQEDLEKSRHQVLNLEAELLHQIECTSKALAAVQSSADVSKLITELAKYRGEASRLEVELLGSTRRAELLSENLTEITREVEELTARTRELEQREEQFTKSEQEARKALTSYQLKYEGGFTREEKDALLLKNEKLQQQLAEVQREAARLKELADIAANQAQTLTHQRQLREEEMKELREYCTRLESRSEDEVLIGRLQRLLMSTKTSYKAFVRKYQHARENIRTREIALRIVETRLSDQEKCFHELSASRRKEILALKQALRNVQEVIVDTVPVGSALPERRIGGVGSAAATTGGGGVSESIEDAAALRVAAMSRALQRGAKLVTSSTGERVVEISSKVDHLEELAENAVTQAAQKEEECRRLMGEVEELQAERSILQARLNDLDTILQGVPTKQQSVATRLITLSEEVRITKLTSLKQRRQIQAMREESKHLRTLIAKMEGDMIELEKNKVNREASEFFGMGGFGGDRTGRGGEGHGHGGSRSILDSLGIAEDPLETELKKSMSRLNELADVIHRGGPLAEGLDGDGGEDATKAGLRDSSEVALPVDSKVLHDLRKVVAASAKEVSEWTLKANHLQGRVQELDQALQEKESQLNYYERVLTEEGLGTVVLRPPAGRTGPSKVPPRTTSMSAVEQEQLQQAATATISSLKDLIEEKNRLIEKYRDKIEQLTNNSHMKTRAERHAEDLLERLAQDELRSRGKLSVIEVTGRSGDGGLPASSSNMSEAYQRLATQVEQADAIIMEKDRTVQQLEQNLSMQTNQRERAELRCGEVLKEMENMKADLLTLAQQLQESEARCLHLSRTHGGTFQPGRDTFADATGAAGVSGAAAVPANSVAMAKYKQLERVVKQKDEKIKSYRTIIVRLKDEFMKGEQEKAIAEVRQKTKQETAAAISPEELRDLKNKISDMYEGLRTAKEDLEKARRAREKLAQERNAALDDVKRLEEQNQKLDSQHTYATQMVNRLKRDLDESRRKETRLRDKLKEYIDREGTAGAAGASGTGTRVGKDFAVKAKDRIDQLERENELLKAQNAALRRADRVDSAISNDLRGIGRTTANPVRARSEEPTDRNGGGDSAASPARGGQVLGGGVGGGDELRQQLHAKWESEKKLQKRVTTLEARLQEMISENDELRAQIQRSKDSLQHALTAKEEAQKKAHSQSRAAQGTESRRLSGEEVMELEQARSRIYALEENVQALTRRADVELLNQIRSLTHQLSISQTRTAELERLLGETEERRKKVASATATGRSLRDSEDRFLREERLRDELDLARRQKLELESALLERDAHALESKFDLEAAEGEIQRLKRRLGEMETAYRSLQTVVNSGGGSRAGAAAAASTMDATSGNLLGSSKPHASKRELELEGVIDAMKRVVEKLRAENDRLKRNIPASTAEPGRTPPADLEKRYNAEKKRADKLDADLQAATERLKGFEESSQKVVAKQQQIATLRKQLKGKEDEVAAVHNDMDRHVQEKEGLKRKIQQLEERIQAMEASLQPHEARSAHAPQEIDGLRKRLSAQQADNDVLRAEVEDLRRRVAATGPSSQVSAQEVKRLQDENARLRNELSAFDMNFFDEIENLKYAHAEAMKKLRYYEQRGR